MMKRPFFLRGYTQADFADTAGRTLPVVTEVQGVHMLDDTSTFLATHRVIRLEKDYWVSEEKLSELSSEDELASQVTLAALFWVGVVALGAVFAALAWLGWLPA